MAIKPGLQIFVLHGPACAGKTTWVKGRLERAAKAGKTVRVISADHYMLDVDGFYKFDPSKLIPAHNDCILQFTELVRACTLADSSVNVIIVDNTNTRDVYAAPYVALARAYGHETLHYVFLPSLEACIERDSKRSTTEQGKNIGPVVIARQHAEMQRLLADWPMFWPKFILNPAL